MKRTGTEQKIEFSKLIFIGVSVVTIATLIFSFVMIWKTMDTTALAYLIPAVFAEAASATGFYYAKAKAENKIKLMKQYNITLDEEQNSDRIGGIENG